MGGSGTSSIGPKPRWRTRFSVECHTTINGATPLPALDSSGGSTFSEFVEFGGDDPSKGYYRKSRRSRSADREEADLPGGVAPAGSRPSPVRGGIARPKTLGENR